MNLISGRVDDLPPVPFAVMPVATDCSPDPGSILLAGTVEDIHPSTRKPIVRKIERPLPCRQVLSIPGAHVIVEHLHGLSFKLRIDPNRSFLRRIRSAEC